GPGELPAHDEREQSTQDHHEEPHEQELPRDHLVIGREDVRPHEAELVMAGVHVVRVNGRAGGAHFLAFPSFFGSALAVSAFASSGFASAVAGAAASAFRFSAAHLPYSSGVWT